jgi:nucleotide-binding universal stress UspA family protein
MSDVEPLSRAASPSVAYRHVLLPLDGSDFAARAAPTARSLAERLGAVLHSVSVAKDAGEADRLTLHAVDVLGPGAADRAHVVVDAEPVDGIERWRAELGATVLCMSTRGRGRAVGAVIGSVARSLLERSTEPIVAVGPSAERPPDFVSRRSPTLPVPLRVPRLVACVDGSEPSEAVLPIAVAWCRKLGMSLTILTIADPSLPPLEPGEVWARRYGPDGDAEEYVGKLASRWRTAGTEVDGEVAYDPISPSKGVQGHLAERPAGLLAVTTQARQGWPRLRLGAVAADVVRAASVPTVVVPPAQRSPDGLGSIDHGPS